MEIELLQRRHCVLWYGFVFFGNVDAAHADDEETHRSTGGWFFFLRKEQGAVAAKSGQTMWGSSAAMQGAFLKQFLRTRNQ